MKNQTSTSRLKKASELWHKLSTRLENEPDPKLQGKLMALRARAGYLFTANMKNDPLMNYLGCRQFQEEITSAGQIVGRRTFRLYYVQRLKN